MPTTTRLHAQLATLAAGWREQAEALALLAKCARGTRRNDELRAQRCAWPPRGGDGGNAILSSCASLLPTLPILSSDASLLPTRCGGPRGNEASAAPPPSARTP